MIPSTSVRAAATSKSTAALPPLIRWATPLLSRPRPRSPRRSFTTPQVLRDPAPNDAGAGDDSITISSEGMVAAGLTSLSVGAGTGDNTLAAHGGTTPLIAINGASLAVSAEDDAIIN